MAGPHRHRSINAPTGFFCFPEERKRNVILCCPNGNDYMKRISNNSSLRNAHIVTPVSKCLLAGKEVCEFCSEVLIDNMETTCSEDFTALLVKFTALFVICRRFGGIWCLCLQGETRRPVCLSSLGELVASYKERVGLAKVGNKLPNNTASY